jgi:hypothetical protein
MKLGKADNVDSVRAACEGYKQYRDLFQAASTSQEKSLEDCFFEHEVSWTWPPVLLQVVLRDIGV